jgi:hypothetical protein
MDKELLTRGGAGPAGLPEDDVEVPDVGTVRVRAMNRGELLTAGKLNVDKGQRDMERYVLSSCMVDPPMSLEDVDAWFAAGPAMEVQPVVHKINELSGVGKDAAKSGVPGNGDDGS